MKIFISFCSFAILANVTFATDRQNTQVDSKQKKRSLGHDEWSNSANFEGAPAVYSGQVGVSSGSAGAFPSSVGAYPTYPGSAGSVGVSTHTDTLTTVREKVPVPFEVIKPVLSPYPV